MRLAHQLQDFIGKQKDRPPRLDAAIIAYQIESHATGPGGEVTVRLKGIELTPERDAGLLKHFVGIGGLRQQRADVVLDLLAMAANKRMKSLLVSCVNPDEGEPVSAAVISKPASQYRVCGRSPIFSCTLCPKNGRQKNFIAAPSVATCCRETFKAICARRFTRHAHWVTGAGQHLSSGTSSRPIDRCTTGGKSA